MIRLATAALLAIGAALPAAARDISGEAGYLPRIALDPGAQLVVELRAPHGIVGEFRADSDGRQVPLPFTVPTDDEGPLILRAAIVTGTVTQWASAPVAVPDGAEPVDLGMVLLQPFVPMGFASRLRCGDALLDVGFVGDNAHLRFGGRVWVLPQAISASGARFNDGATPETEVWTKGNMAMVTIEGRSLPECEALAMPASLPMVARGHEPGWVLDISDDGLLLARHDGSEIRTPLPAPDVAPEDAAADEARGMVFTTGPMTVTVTPEICRDTMSGMPHPLSVALVLEDEELQGCGGDPADLLQGVWEVQELGGASLPVDAGVTIEVSGTHLAGSTGCNRYVAGLDLSGEALSIPPGPVTMMACDQEADLREREFLDALGRVTGFDLDGISGALLLTGGEEVLLRALPAG